MVMTIFEASALLTPLITIFLFLWLRRDNNRDKRFEEIKNQMKEGFYQVNERLSKIEARQIEHGERLSWVEALNSLNRVTIDPLKPTHIRRRRSRVEHKGD